MQNEDGRTEGWTDGRNAENYVPTLFFEKAGDKKKTNILHPKLSVDNLNILEISP